MKLLPIVAVSVTLAFGAAGLATAQDQSAPVASPNATPNPAVKSPNDMTNAPLAEGKNSFTKREAKLRIMKAGYSHVTDLAKDTDGLWQAHATKDGQPISVALDYKGDVASK